MFSNLKNLLHNDDGATLVEYSLIVALIAGVCIAVITTLGKQIASLFTSIGSKMPGTTS